MGNPPWNGESPSGMGNPSLEWGISPPEWGIHTWIGESPPRGVGKGMWDRKGQKDGAGEGLGDPKSAPGQTDGAPRCPGQTDGAPPGRYLWARAVTSRRQSPLSPPGSARRIRSVTPRNEGSRGSAPRWGRARLRRRPLPVPLPVPVLVPLSPPVPPAKSWHWRLMRLRASRLPVGTAETPGCSGRAAGGTGSGPGGLSSSTASCRKPRLSPGTPGGLRGRGGGSGSPALSGGQR